MLEALITAELTEMPRSFSISIQSERARRRSPRAFTAGKLDRAAEQQELLGERSCRRRGGK